MGTQRWRASLGLRRIGRREATLLLTGGRPSADRDRLDDLLAAASSPPLPHELRDREVVLAAFARASLEDGLIPERASARLGRGAVWGWASRARVAAVLGVALLSGTAAAAHAGALPAPIQDAAHDLLSGAGVPPASERHDDDDQGGSDDPAGLAPPSSLPGSEPSDDPNEVRELCLSFREASRAGERADAADLAALARLAGDEARVPTFCELRLAGEPSSSSDNETHGSTPSPTPTDDNGDQQLGSGDGGAT